MPFDITPTPVTRALPVLTNAERSALVALRDDLQSGVISPDTFDMTYLQGSRCCIHGHLRMRAQAFIAVNDPRFASLFNIGRPQDICEAAYFATPAQAVTAIDNFLTLGEPAWDQVMSTP